jgi:hypothetical protein
MTSDRRAPAVCSDEQPVTIVVHHVDGSRAFEFTLPAAQVARWKAVAAARGQTLSESFEEIIIMAAMEEDGDAPADPTDVTE